VRHKAPVLGIPAADLAVTVTEFKNKLSEVCISNTGNVHLSDASRLQVSNWLSLYSDLFIVCIQWWLMGFSYGRAGNKIII
jgi:hypothetical protein